MVVQSFGALQSLTESPAAAWGGPTSASTVNLYGHAQSYATIYATQPNIRTCVDFLARNIAELTLHVYRRISDTDRERLVDHDLVRWLGRPNPTTRRYRLFEALVSDLGIYFNACWLKIPHAAPDGRTAVGLARIPPEEFEAVGGLLPSHVVWTRNGRTKDLTLEQIVRYDGYNPLNPLMGLSPLETLRRVLAEELVAGEHREAYWRHASRMDGVIERPAAAPKWTDAQKKAWREQWQERFAGAAGAGMVAVLEDGMIFKPASFSPKESEYSTARKLTREECAAAYHIPLPLVGILEHATFSNIKEQHKHLYQDCLGPWLRMIKEEIEGQLLIECEDQRDVYTEFNIDAKLAGSFEERAGALQLSIGRPWRTVNEGRAIENLPRDEDPESDRIAPQQGGPSDATARPGTPPAFRRDDPDDPDEDDEDDDEATAAAPILAFHARRIRPRLAKVAALEPTLRPAALAGLRARWTIELMTDLAPVVGADAAERLAHRALTEISAEGTE